MADRIIKGDSGNDVIIQNNDASRKIEVTNSGDVEVTGDFKATTVKATNLKANDGTAALVVADSTGEVTSSGGLKATTVKATNLKANDGTAGISIADSTGRITFTENNPLITLGSNTTFPDGMVVDKQYYKYSLSSSGSYIIQSSSLVVATRTSSSNASAQNITIEAEHTYIYEFLIYQKLYRFSSTPSNRFFKCGVYEGTTQVDQGSTSIGTKLSLGINGRGLIGVSSVTAPSYGYYSYIGGVYYGSGATTSRYVYLAADSEDTNKYLQSHMDATYPMYLVITKIKGNKATDIT